MFPRDFLEAATGPVTIPMNNDYLFRALLQRNNYVLKGLICSLLHLDEEVRLQCEAREDYYRLQKSKDLEVERAKAERDAAVAALAEKDAALVEKDAALAEKDAVLAELQAEVTRLKGR